MSTYICKCGRRVKKSINADNTGLTHVKWAVPAEGAKMKFTVFATGGATLRLQIKSDGTTTYDSKDLANGQSVHLKWPASPTLTLIATSGTNGPSSLKAELVPAL